jgi:phospholipid-binding lipoprotein MlaA
MRRLSRLAAAAAAAAALSGCAAVRSPDPRDPWEPMNRGTFEFNDGVDRVALKPLAEAYRFVLPEPVRAGVRNFFENLRDPWIALNQLLQGKVEEALSDGWRFIANSTFGLGGIFDIASDMGMPKHNEDFGQTLAVWGVDFGPYLVIPILGPSSVRDATGTAVATQAYLPWQLPEWLDVDHRVAWQNWLTGIDIVQTRANLLDATDLLEQAALDRYAFIRNAYFQRRRNLIYDGNPPPLPPSEPEPGGAESKIPANYEAALAAGARHAAAADRSQERIP